MNVKDKKHYTPLHAAAAGGQCHAVKMLLELGANVSNIKAYLYNMLCNISMSFSVDIHVSVFVLQ